MNLTPPSKFVLNLDELMFGMSQEEIMKNIFMIFIKRYYATRRNYEEYHIIFFMSSLLMIKRVVYEKTEGKKKYKKGEKYL